jgi:voltage-gated potassium channel
MLNSPVRNLIGGVLFVLTVGGLAVVGYMSQGWNFGDALYMVVLTVFTVGYDELEPVATVPLRAITMGLIVTGCTGMIFLTGALVQCITLSGIQQLLGHKHMNHQIEQMRNHVIVCGFGRIGNMLTRELKAGGALFVILERSPNGSRMRAHSAICACTRTPRTRRLCGRPASSTHAPWPPCCPMTRSTCSSPSARAT